MRISDWSSDVCSSDLGVNEDTTEPGLTLAFEEGSIGNLVVDGDGSMIELTQVAPSDTGNGTFGPFLQVGRLGEGNMTVSGGADVRLEGDSARFTLGHFVTGDGPALVDGQSGRAGGRERGGW